MVEVADRITVNPEQCGGRPCIRGLRIRVIDVLDLLASGLTAAQVVEELLTPRSKTSRRACVTRVAGSITPSARREHP